MDLRKLRYFAQIVEAKSMSRAAASLNVAQPALSKSIQSLEQDLETPLLQRSAQGVVTTEAGERLYEHCQILFQQLERAWLEVRKSVEKPSGHVVVGMPYSIVATLAVPLLEATTRLYPGVHLELAQDHSHVLSTQLRSARLDFAVMASPRSSSGLAYQPLLLEELFFVERSQGEGGAPSPAISFADASRREYILPTVGNGLRAFAEGSFRARSLPLDVKHEVDAIPIIPRCVQAGLGATILPGGCLGADARSEHLNLRPFEEGGCHRVIVTCQALAKAPTPAALTIMSLAQQLARDLVTQDRWLGARLT
jgi:DNA-binding transcriptional LysR family regulator